MRRLLLTLAAIVMMAGTASAYTALQHTITTTGVEQGDLVTFLGNVRDAVNELIDDHATYKATVDAAVTELTELKADHDADNAAIIADLKALVNQVRTSQLYIVRDNPAFAISTNFDVKNANAVYYTNGGTLKTLAANTNCDTGTSQTITGSKFQAAILTVNASGTCVVTFAPTAVYASEAAAIAALTAPAATDTVLGYFTIQAHASGFTAGTDALTTGAGGNVATATTYYNSINPNTLVIGAAVSSSPAAALTAANPAAGPATLTNNTALKLTP